MRYRRDPDPQLGARVQLFLVNTNQAELRLAADAIIRLREKTPDEQGGPFRLEIHGIKVSPTTP